MSDSWSSLLAVIGGIVLLSVGLGMLVQWRENSVAATASATCEIHKLRAAHQTEHRWLGKFWVGETTWFCVDADHRVYWLGGDQ